MRRVREIDDGSELALPEERGARGEKDEADAAGELADSGGVPGERVPVGRALLRGSLRFRGQDIPMALHSATTAPGPKLRLLHAADGSPIRLAYVCEQEGRLVPYEALGRGVTVGARHLLLESQELAGARSGHGGGRSAAPGERVLTLVDFVPMDSVPMAYLATPYHLVPEPEGVAPLAVLRTALWRERRVAVGRLWLHGSLRLLGLWPTAARLMAFGLRFSDELLPTPRQPAATPIPRAALEEARQFIKAHACPFEPERYADEYHRKLRGLVMDKLAGAPRTAPRAALSG